MIFNFVIMISSQDPTKAAFIAYSYTRVYLDKRPYLNIPDADLFAKKEAIKAYKLISKDSSDTRRAIRASEQASADYRIEFGTF